MLSDAAPSTKQTLQCFLQKPFLFPAKGGRRIEVVFMVHSCQHSKFSDLRTLGRILMMNKSRMMFLLSIIMLALALFLIIFSILFYSLAIIEMVNDGLMGPFIFIIFLVSIAFTAILLIKHYYKNRVWPPRE